MSLDEANQLINKYVALRHKVKQTKDEKLIKELRTHEQLCLQKFKHLVLMKTSRYKNFNNYEDLNQEGCEAVLKAMKSFNPDKKSNIFWWLHKYIDTRIARSANLHTTIRFPLKYTKTTIPHREAALPIMLDEINIPDDMFDRQELVHVVRKTFDALPDTQREVAQMLFGMNGDDPKSITKICDRFQISRTVCTKLVDQVFVALKRNISCKL